MNSIPASQLASVIPGVLGAGGNPLSLNGLLLDDNPTIPIDADLGYLVLSFPTADAVGAYFGLSSPEYDAALIYFAGFNNSTTLPGTLYFVQYNTAAVAAYLRSGSLVGTTLAQLQALSGTVIVSIDGSPITSANIDLSSATSFSNAAALIQTGLRTPGGIFSGTATQAGTTLTVASTVSGAIHVGDTIVGANIGPATVLAQLSPTTWTLSTTETVTPAEAVTISSTATVTWNAQLSTFVITSSTTGVDSTLDSFATGTLAAAIKLQSAQGAILSQGAAIATPAVVLNDVVGQTQNWIGYTTLDEYDTDEKVALAAWANSSGQRYMYVGWDTDVGPTQGPDADSFAVLTASNNGRVAIWSPLDKAVFILGTTAAINFAQTNGRITFAYKGLAGLVPDVTDVTIATNLLANGYNLYGAYATANDQFRFLQNGQISGTWKWIDAYVNQVKLNSDFQLAFITLMSQATFIPYVGRGYDQFRAAAMGPINSALNFGSIVAGVTLSASQRQQIMAATNTTTAADTLQSRGWYLQILDADPTVRAGRNSPPMTFWYTDGGSIQKINLASINVQ